MGLPSLEAMWPHYPNIDYSQEGVATLVGGAIGKAIVADPNHLWDTCCVRTSRALNKGGAVIGGLSRITNPYMDPPKVRALNGADNLPYIYSVYDMRVYLSVRYGRPKRFAKGSTKTELAKEGVKGIVMFFPHHSDLWNGSDVRYNDQLFGDPRVQELLVWIAAPSDPKVPT